MLAVKLKTVERNKQSWTWCESKAAK